MKLTTTRNMLKSAFASVAGLRRFDQAYPNIDPDQEIDLLDMLTNGINTVQEVVWCLCATVQDSKYVSVAFAERCAARAADYATSAATSAADSFRAASAADSFRAALAANAACEAADDAAHVATYAAERKRQKQDLIELLS